MKNKFLNILLILSLMVSAFLPANAWTVSPIRFEIGAERGKEYTFAFSVLNESQLKQVRFEAKVNDWTLGEDNSFIVGTDMIGDRVKTSAKSWVKITPKQFVIPPGGVRKVRFTVKVPDDPNISGDYTLGIFVGERNIEKPPKGERIVHIKQSTNVGVIVYVTVGDKKKEVELKGIDFKTKNVQDNLNAVLVLPKFHNKGNTHARGKVTLKMKPISYPEVKSVDENTSVPTLLPVDKINKEIDAGEVVLLREAKLNYPIQIPQVLPEGSEWDFEVISDFGKKHPLVVGKKRYKIPPGEKADTKKDKDGEKIKDKVLEKSSEKDKDKKDTKPEEKKAD